MLIVFVVLPLGLPMFGISPLNSIAVAVLTAGTFADAFTTRYGFRFGGSELNPIFKLTRNHLGQDGFLAFMATTKVSLGLALLIFLPYPYLLFLLALISLSGVLFNSIGLAFSAH
jgi:hypothetical protein